LGGCSSLGLLTEALVLVQTGTEIYGRDVPGS
jgi:hypothetical protein